MAKINPILNRMILNRIMNRPLWYSIVVFLTSSVLLIIEMVAARLIAPYVGVSLYSWTAVIAVVLAGVSIGNWWGGYWADHGGGAKHVGWILLSSAIVCLASLVFLEMIAPLIQAQGFGLVQSSLSYVAGMFLLPSVFLGVITPLLTTLALNDDLRTGFIVGRMHAVAALGSIAGTVITGFWLIQTFGTRSIVLGCSAILFLLALSFLLPLNRRRSIAIISLLGVAVVLIMQNGLLVGPCTRESQYFCIRIVDASEQAPYGEAKAMVLDHLLHGVNHKEEPQMLLSSYVHLMDELVLHHFGFDYSGTLAFFFAGGGSYTQPRAVEQLYKSRITVAEIDPLVTKLAQQKMYVETANMRIFHEDARVALSGLETEKFDVIVTDVFHDISIPYHLLTQEFAQLVASRLTASGLYVMNLVDLFPDPKLVKSVYLTLNNTFKHVHVWLDALPAQTTRMTFVISAAHHSEAPDILTATRGFKRKWFRINEPMVQTGTPLAQLSALTDDFVPVERLISGILLDAELHE